MLTPIVEIAHIRSRKPKGPRHEPAYPKHLLDDEENCLLLCSKHHKVVDDHPSKYRADELIEWKKYQVADRTGRTLSDSEVAQISDSPKGTETSLEVEAVGVADIRGAWISVPLQALPGLDVPDSDRYLGVTVTNTGRLPANIIASGIDLGVDYSPLHATHLFDDGNVDPHIPPQVSSTWRIPQRSLAAGILKLATERGILPDRFRPYARPASGDRVEGPWQSAVDLPIWRPGMTQDKLSDLLEKAAAHRHR